MSDDSFEKGIQIRKELAGAEYVERLLADPEDFAHPMQELVTEYCWGAVWTRPGLDRRSRSLLNLGMLAAANRPEELAGHIKIALKNGVTRPEIQECFLQVAVYMGMPAGLACFKIAKAVFAELEATP